MTIIAQTEKQYLTSERDVIDRVCWDFYGSTQGTAEAVYRRNTFLSRYPAVLPPGLVITLPVVSLTALRQVRELWDYGTVKKSDAGRVAATVDNRLSAAQSALNHYRATKYSLPASEVVDDVKELTEAEWLGVYYKTASGTWKQARMHKSNLQFEGDADNLSVRVQSLEESLTRFNLMEFVPAGAARLEVQDSVVRMVFDRSKFAMSDAELEQVLRPMFPQYTLETCQGDVQVIGPIPRRF